MCVCERIGVVAGQDRIRYVFVLLGSEMFSFGQRARRRGGCSSVTEQLLCGTLLMSGHLCMHHHGAAPV